MCLGNVAVRRPRNVQSTSMVALAPITNETPIWDVLDTFPKLHSRAREAKVRSCTEAPHSKSLVRVEIWQTIYETRDRLESFTRDPIEFEGSEWNLYETKMFLSRMDPTGLFCADEKAPCSDADGKGGLDPNTAKVYHLCMALCKSTLPIKNPLDVCKNCKKLPPLARPMCDYLCKEAKKHTPLNNIPDPKEFLCDKMCCSGKLPDGVPGDECVTEFYKEDPARTPGEKKKPRTREQGERACLRCCEENYPFHAEHKNMCQRACTLTWPIIVED